MAKFLKINNYTVLNLNFLVSFEVRSEKYVGKKRAYHLELRVNTGAYFKILVDTLQQVHYLKMRIPQVCIKDGEFYQIYYDEKNKYWDVKVCPEADFRDFENLVDPDEEPEEKEKETFTRQ